MSYLSERINQIAHGVANLGNVLESRYNQAKREAGVLSPEIEGEADRRYSICVDCPFNSLRAQTSEEYKKLTGTHFHTDLTELTCSLCSCPIHYKTLSMNSNCGIEYWNQTHANNTPLPLKWEAYKL